MDIETRSFRVPFEIRKDGENQTIVGYASTFDQPYPVDMVTEIIDRSAFTRTLSEKPDVYALIGHDPSRILGRTKNGTLSLSIDERGLKCVITPVMTRDAEDTLKLIASGCIDAMSFGFKVVKQAFGYADGKTTRRITDLELHEVSCVAFPANENATLSLRAKQMAKEYRASQFSDADFAPKPSNQIIFVKRDGDGIYADDQDGNTIVSWADGYDDEAEFFESQGIKDMKDVEGFADDLVGRGLASSGDIVKSQGKTYKIRSSFETRNATVRLTVKKMSRAEPFPSSGSFVFDGKTVYQVVSNDSYLTDAKTVSVEAKRIGEPTDFSEEQMLGAYKGSLERSSSKQLENRAHVGKDRWQGNYGDIEIPPEAWQEMSGSGQKDSAVSRWVNSPKIVWTMDDEAIAKELKEHGAWSEKELSNAKENKKRILWIASNDISEGEGRSSSTKLETRAKGKVREFIADSYEERGRWTIEVTMNGKTVYSYDSDNDSDKDDLGYEPTEQGWMKGVKDYSGLANWMVHLGVMEKGEFLSVVNKDGAKHYARSSSAIKLLELRHRIAPPIDNETRGLADFALMASAGLGLFLVSKIVSGVLFFWYDCAYNTYGGGKKKVRVSAKTDKDAIAEVKKLNPEAQDIEVQKVKK